MRSSSFVKSSRRQASAAERVFQQITGQVATHSHRGYAALSPPRWPDSLNPEAASCPPRRGSAGRTAEPRIEARIGGVGFTEPGRILIQDPCISKIELARYYDAVGENLLGHLKGRPLQLVMTPQPLPESDRISALAQNLPAGVVLLRTEPSPSFGVESVEGIIGLVQKDVVELHTEGTRAPALAYPDRIVFKLRPHAKARWPALCAAALALKSVTDALRLPAFVKTAGDDTLDIVIPVKQTRSWTEIQMIAQAIAERVVTAQPSLVGLWCGTSVVKPVSIDASSNCALATTIAAFSIRMRAGAPVSIPLSWQRLDPDEPDPLGAALNLRNVHEWLENRHGDPWSGYGRARRAVTASMVRELGLDPSALRLLRPQEMQAPPPDLGDDDDGV